MYTLRVQALAAGHAKQGFNDRTADPGSGRFSGNPKAIATTGDFNIEAAFDLTQVFVKLAAEIGKAAVIGGLQENVPGYFVGVQWSGNTPSDCCINVTTRLHRTNAICIAKMRLKTNDTLAASQATARLSIILPRSEFGSASVICTSTNWPRHDEIGRAHV